MSFNAGNSVRRDSCDIKSFSDDGRLTELAWGREAHFVRTVVVDGRAEDNSVNCVSGPERVFESPECNYAGTAPCQCPRCLRVKRSTMAVGRTYPTLLVKVSFLSWDLDRNASCQGDIAMEVEEAGAGEVNCDERCGTSGADCQARAGEIKLIRDPGCNIIL